MQGSDSCRNRAVDSPGPFLKLELLEKIGVRHSVVLQCQGNLVYVGREIPHMVLNLGVNVADAMLFSTPPCTRNPTCLVAYVLTRSRT